MQQKFDVLRRSPYDETSLLDTDTTILGSFVAIVDLGTVGNFALAKAYRIVSSDTGEDRIEPEHPDDFDLTLPATFMDAGP